MAIKELKTLTMKMIYTSRATTVTIDTLEMASRRTMRLLVDGLEQRALLGEEKNAFDSEVSDPALDG